jgi:hypothetical protein
LHAADIPLKHDSMTFLNNVLKRMPIVTIKLNSTAKAIRKTMKDVKDFTALRTPHDELTFVDLQLKLILDPVRDFFDNVIEHSATIKPILEESNILHPQLERPLLLTKFFSPDNKRGIETFCKDEVKNIHGLKKLCAELMHFINDINKSLSSEAKAAYHAKLEEMKIFLKAHSTNA